MPPGAGEEEQIDEGVVILRAKIALAEEGSCIGGRDLSVINIIFISALPS